MMFACEHASNVSRQGQRFVKMYYAHYEVTKKHAEGAL